MNRSGLLRWCATLGILLVAAVLVFMQYRAYFQNPWTRDGLVQAQVVELAARVSGPVVAVHVVDNQAVRAGELLFELEDSVYQAAVVRAEATLAQQEALARRARDTAKRDVRLQTEAPGAVSQQATQDASDMLEAAEAGVRMARAALREARLDLKFTKIVAPVDGYITNLHIQPGGMVVAYQPFVALIDSSTFWVDAFFRETLIRDFQPGDEALVTLMSYPDTPLRGRVLSVGWGIAQSNGSTGEKLLPKVSPTFEWIRLAQRIPVRVKLESVPPNVKLRMGTTASVLVRAHF